MSAIETADAPVPAAARPRWPIAVPLAVAAVVRLAYGWAYWREVPTARAPVVDAEVYLHLAQSLRAGNWDDPHLLHHSFLYPLLIAALPFEGEALCLAVVVLQLALGVLGVSLVAGTVGALWGRRWLVCLAGLGATVASPLLFFETKLYPMALSVTLLLVVLRLMAARRHAWLLGSAVGLLVLLRSEAVLLLPVLLYWAWTADGPPSRGARLAGLAVPLALCLAGAAWRNTRIAGTFVPTPTISSGLLLHLGNNPNADGSYGPPDGFDGTILQQNMVAKRLAEQAVGRPLDAVAVDRHWLRVAAGYLAAHPARALELLGRKLLGYVDPRELILDLGFGLERARLPVLRVMLLPFPALLLLGTIGWLADRRDPRRRATRDAIAATALPSLVVCLVFFAQSRYRMSALAPALVFAPRGLEALRAWAAAGARGRLGAAAAAAAVVVAAVALARQRDTPREEAVARYNEAFAWERRRDAARARASFEAAFALAPDQPALRTDYARTLLQSGDVARAEAVLREGLATQPRAGVLLVMLGWVLYQQGRTGEAEAQFRTALAHEPANVAAKLSLAIAVRDRATDPPTLRQVAVVFAEVAATNDLKYARPALLGLGMTYARLGDAEQAEAAFRRMAHGQAPNALEESEWGFALYQLGRYAEARPHCRRAVELEPRNPIAHYRCALVEEQLGDAAAARAHLAQARALGLAVGGP